MASGADSPYRTSAAVCVALLRWTRSPGSLRVAGAEGTAAYGAGAMQCLCTAGVSSMEVNHPNRARCRRLGRSDATDAENAARAVLAGEAEAVAKVQGDIGEALRALLVAHRNAIKARTQSANQFRALLVTVAPGEWERLGRGTPSFSVACRARLVATDMDFLASARRRDLRTVARRWQQLIRELHELHAAITPLIR
jgi:transposase